MVINKLAFTDPQQAILKTLLYSEIFAFVLTKEEIWQFLISNQKIAKEDFLQGLHELSEIIVSKNGFYCLRGQEVNILSRRKNAKEIHKKMNLAKKAVFYLSFIPTIKFIGISGGLALENVKKEDDIDFFIIVEKNTLFMTRFWILLLLEWLNLRRRRNEQNASNKICVNFLLDETKIVWPVSKRDLYIAHEIAQLKPVFEREGMYKQFMASNKWIEQFLPNTQKNSHKTMGKNWKTNYYNLRFLNNLLELLNFELIVKKIQRFYIKRHITVEVVTDRILAFHPNDYRVKTLEALRTKCAKIGLLTNF
ncbi:MAG TPA: hypothetical protein VF810_01820 [Patescibacteria group bacterium]